MPGIKIPIRVSETDTGPGSYFTESADSGSLEMEADTVELNTNIETDAVREPAFISSEERWKDRALHMHARASRMQAEMDGFRERQRRIAQEQVRTEQDRLLADVLLVADNLDRTLAASQETRRDAGAVSLIEGVALTRDEMMRVLSRYGVERIEALGRPFDPRWHEALHVVPAGAYRVEAGTVVQVTQAGYRRGERLLRPARVVVAQ